MPTRDDLAAEIADDIDDTTGEYAGQIVRAILAAQRYCERSTYYFNETRDQTFQTVQGQEWYGASANANIPTLVNIDALFRADPADNVIEMRRVSPRELEVLSDNSASIGEPYCWTYFGQRIRIYPIPDRAYTIRMQIGPYRLGPLTSGTDENAWLTEAYDLIKARAKYIIHKDTLKDGTLATEAFNDWRDQDAALAAETSSRNGSGCIKPTCF